MTPIFELKTAFADIPESTLIAVFEEVQEEMQEADPYISESAIIGATKNYLRRLKTINNQQQEQK
jgi:hypothetical protein